MWISGRAYVDTRVGDLRDYHNSEVGSMGAELQHLRTAIEATSAELQRQVTELHGEGLTRKEYDAKHDPFDTRLKKLENWQANIIGRLVALGIVYSIVLIFFTYYITHNGHL